MEFRDPIGRHTPSDPVLYGTGMVTKEMMLDEMRRILRRGERLPTRPSPEALYDATGGKPEEAVMVTLEWLAARRIALSEVGVFETSEQALANGIGGHRTIRAA